MGRPLGWLVVIAGAFAVGLIAWVGGLVPASDVRPGAAREGAAMPDAGGHRAVALHVVDLDGRPVADARVLVWPDAEAFAREPSSERLLGRTDADGRLRTGPLALDARVCVTDDVRGGTGCACVGDLPEASRMDTEVVLRPRWTCSGLVRWSDGSQASGAALEVVAADDGTWQPRVLGERETDVRGSFAVDVEAAARVWVAASAEGVRSEVQPVEEPPRDGPRNARRVSLELPGGWIVRGTVSEPDGQPARNVTVFLDRERSGTDSRGRFAFANVSPGAHAVVASPSGAFIVAGYTTNPAPWLVQAEPCVVDVRPDDRLHDVELRLVPTTTLSGTIVRECPDVDASDLLVWAEPAADELARRAGLVAPTLQVKTGTFGEFRVEGVHPDVAYDVFVREANMAPYLVVGRGLRADAGPQRLVVPCGAADPPVVRGVVRDACDGRGLVAQVTARFFVLSGARESTPRSLFGGTTSAPDGRFALDLAQLGCSGHLRERVSLVVVADGREPLFVGPLDAPALREPFDFVLRPCLRVEVALHDDDLDAVRTISFVGRVPGQSAAPRVQHVGLLDGPGLSALDGCAERIDLVQVRRAGYPTALATRSVDAGDPCDPIVHFDVTPGGVPEVDAWLRAVDVLGDPIASTEVTLRGSGPSQIVTIAADGIGHARLAPGLWDWELAPGGTGTCIVPPEGGMVVLELP